MKDFIKNLIVSSDEMKLLNNTNDSNKSDTATEWLDEMQSITEEEYYRALYKAEKEKPVDVKQQFIDWIYENYSIGNGDMLLDRMEDTQTQWAFIKEFGLDDDVELI